MDNLRRLLAVSIRTIIYSLPQAQLSRLEEIRLRAEQPLSVRISGAKYFVTREGAFIDKPYGAYIVSRDECIETISHATEYSIYASDRTIAKGFITVSGGLRIGVAGEGIGEGQYIKSVKNIMSICIRIPRQIMNAADDVAPYVIHNGGVTSALIVSPPGMGKTTILRELARLASEKGRNVAIVDERSELAACCAGIPQFKLGPRCDVLDGVNKAEGMMMMVRSMSPDVVVTDEIGRQEDAGAILTAMSSGVKVFASLHGAGIKDVASKDFMERLISAKAFGAYIFLSSSEVGSISKILDADLKPLDTNRSGEVLNAQYCS